MGVEDREEMPGLLEDRQVPLQIQQKPVRGEGARLDDRKDACIVGGSVRGTVSLSLGYARHRPNNKGGKARP